MFSDIFVSLRVMHVPEHTHLRMVNSLWAYGLDEVLNVKDLNLLQ